MVRYLSGADVEEALGAVDPVEVVASTLKLHARGGTTLPAEAALYWSPPGGGTARSLTLPAFIGDELAVGGAKIINANPANVDRGRPRASGVTLLFDPVTAQVVAILQAGTLSSARTAAVSFVACAAVTDRTPVKLGIIGAGPIAWAHLATFCGRLPAGLDVEVYDLRAQRARRIIDRARAELAGHRYSVAGSAESAVRGASIVVAATVTTEPYIRPEWLDPGAVVVNVSLDDVTAEALMSVTNLVVDDWDIIAGDGRRLLGRLAAAGVVTGPGNPAPADGRAVTADIGSVLLDPNLVDRTASATTVVNPFGLAINDVALAAAVLRQAQQLGLGTTLPE